MNDLAKLATSVSEFADRTAMTLIPAVPEHDVGPEVCLEPSQVELEAFLALADKLGGGVLYLKAEAFDPTHDDVADPPSHLRRRAGHVCLVSVAFAANGIVHFWELNAPWHTEWLKLVEGASPRFSFTPRSHEDDGEPDGMTDADRIRLAGALADKLLGMPEFRAAKMGGARQRLAKLHIPADTDRSLIWTATREACDRAEELTQAQYSSMEDRYDELARKLLSSASYQRASTPGVRKQVAEQFLIAHGDGFCPPAHVRDELYARTQQIAKTAGRAATQLWR